MKIPSKIFILGALLLTGVVTNAQEKITSLKIGDKVPDLVLTHLLNNDKAVNLSSLHQQDLLIINFWATWCVPCIRELSKLDSLATLYKGKVKVLSVAYENETTVKAFFIKHPEISTSNLLIPTGDTVLVQYFRHRVIPHNIWVDKNGIVKNITGEEEINDTKITAFINNGTLKGSNKIDIIDFNMYETFHLKDTDFMYRSILTGFTNGINGGTNYQAVWHHPTERWIIRLFTFNSSKQQIIWQALNQMNSFKDYYHIMKVQTTDSTRFFWPKECPQSFSKSKFKSRQEWMEQNAYCYELTLPKAVKDTDFFMFMKNDLERVFQVEITKTNQKRPVCLIGIKNKRQFTIPQNDSSFIDLSSTMLKVHNVQIIRLLQYLNEKIKPDINSIPIDPPFIDNTGIQHRIDLKISFNKEMPAYEEIKEALKDKYGFRFEIKTRDYPVFTVKDLVP